MSPAYRMLIYTQVLSLLEGSNKKVIQFQMFGLGNIWHQRSQGALQLAVALKIASKLRENFPALTVTSQEPCMYPAEIEYLQSRNIHVFEGSTFSPNHFIKAAAEAAGFEPVMIVYMIHFPCDAFDGFLEAHWDAKLLSRIIFVANELAPWYHVDPWSRQRIEYAKLCNSKALPFEWHRNPDSPDRLRTYFAFSGIKVYTISYENAKRLVRIVR